MLWWSRVCACTESVWGLASTRPQPVFPGSEGQKYHTQEPTVVLTVGNNSSFPDTFLPYTLSLLPGTVSRSVRTKS